MYVYVCMYVRVCVFMQECTYVCMFVCTCMCVYVCVHACMSVYNTHTHTHTHTHVGSIHFQKWVCECSLLAIWKFPVLFVCWCVCVFGVVFLLFLFKEYQN